MADNNIPELTLEPTATAAAMPELTLDGVPTPATPAAEPVKEEAQPVKLDEELLTDEEKKAVEDFSKKIDITDSNLVLNYGAAAQKSVASFSENALASVRNKDLGEVGDTLSKLVLEVKGFGKEEKKGIAGIFQKQKDKLALMKEQYSKAESSVERITRELENHQVTLLKDIAMFDQMYELNLKYYKELTMYIIAGKKRLEEIRAGELEELRKKAESTGLAEDAQAYNDMAQLCNRFEKKIHDLELTRMVSLQMGPQTRLLQNNDTLMVEKIQSSLVNTIPLWKSQMVLALGMEHSRQATAAQNAVTEATNDLLKKNAEMLKMGTIATAKEAERSIIDIETLQHTNEQLITTLDEVINIQREGAAKRKAAEVELGRIEGELKQKLMELRS
ncbi:MAG: toxic anion resistance protein [Oscillospiraceae bacterium]|nr:toxic anion resistance protein [Oscillospiraceae bacterium]